MPLVPTNCYANWRSNLLPESLITQWKSSSVEMERAERGPRLNCRRVRSVYLITYSKASVEIIASRESFAMPSLLRRVHLWT